MISEKQINNGMRIYNIYDPLTHTPNDFYFFELLNDAIKKGYKFTNIAVNISPVQLNRTDFNKILLNTCDKYNISPSLVEIEILTDFQCNIIQGYYFSKPLSENGMERLLIKIA